MPRYSHILLPGAGEAERYTATRSGSPAFRTPPRNRTRHAAQLIRSIRAGSSGPWTVSLSKLAVASTNRQGLILTFESDPGFPLAFESLDLQNSQIQLLAVTTDSEDRTVATVHVPDDKVHILLRKLESYRDFNPDTPQGRENRKLVESIANIKLATLRELWTDNPALYPAAHTIITWEVWLRRCIRPSSLRRSKSLANAAPDFGYEVVSNVLTFVDRIIVLVRATREQLSRGAEILGIIAEVRKAKVIADFFSSLTPNEQHAWSDELLQRVQPANGEALRSWAYLDTGVNRGHPLLSPDNC